MTGLSQYYSGVSVPGYQHDQTLKDQHTKSLPERHEILHAFTSSNWFSARNNCINLQPASPTAWPSINSVSHTLKKRKLMIIDKKFVYLKNPGTINIHCCSYKVAASFLKVCKRLTQNITNRLGRNDIICKRRLTSPKEGNSCHETMQLQSPADH